MITELSTAQVLQQDARLWESVFVRDLNTDALPLFNSEVSFRDVFFPAQYRLEPVQWIAVQRAAREIHDRAVLLVYTEVLDMPDEDWAKFSDPPRHWRVPIDQLDRIQELQNWPLEHVVFSENGLWGIFFGTEGAAYVGGTSAFGAHLLAADATLAGQRDAYTSYMVGRFGDDPEAKTALAKFLEHLYGQETAGALLGQHRS